MAPIAWTSARLFSRKTPAMAPATADVREVPETLMTLIVISPCPKFSYLRSNGAIPTKIVLIILLDFRAQSKHYFNLPASF
jgi:hypothetical protein